MKLLKRSKDLSLSQELLLSTVVVSLQDHKINPEKYRTKSFIIRKGWASFLKLCKGEK